MNKKAGFTLKGFTLIELLVVISIIGVIMAFSFVGFSRVRKSARDTKRKADLEQIRSALEIYRNDCKTYPAAITPGSPLVCAGNTYMSVVPADSTTGQIYYYSGSTNSYTLCAYLETMGVVSLTGCTNKCGAPNNCNYKTTQP